MRFKDFLLNPVLEDYILFEGVRINPSILKSVISQSTDMNMGFEIELMTGGKVGGVDVDIDGLSFNDIDTYFDTGYGYDRGELSEFLSDHLELFSDPYDYMEKYYKDWFSNNEGWYEKWLEENDIDPESEDRPDEKEVKQTIIEDELEDDAKEYAREQIEEGLNDQEIAEAWWHEDRHGFLQAMGWNLLDEYNYDDDGYITSKGSPLEDVAARLEHVINDEVVVFTEYHEEQKDTTRWYVEPDSSLGEGGAEIVSPVKDPQESLADMEKIFDWMDQSDYETTSETGLHISLSFKEEPEEDMDWVKLAVLMGEDYVLKAFDRVGNSYTKPQLDRVVDAIQNDDIESFREWDGYQKLHSTLKHAINSEKYSTFNIGNFEESGRIEFRLMGGKDYHHKSKEIHNGVGRYIMFLKIARDPQMFRKEYLRKLTKLIKAPKEDTLQSRQKQLAGVEDKNKKWLQAFLSVFGNIKKGNTDLATVLGDILGWQEEVHKSPDNHVNREQMVRTFWDLMGIIVTPVAKQLTAEGKETLLSSILNEAERMGKIEKAKKLVRKLAQEIHITKDDFQNYYNRIPSDAAKKINLATQRISPAGLAAYLVFPDIESVAAQQIEETRKIMKLVNKVSGRVTKELLFDLIRKLLMSSERAAETVSVYDVTGQLRNFLVFLQMEPTRNDPEMKKLVKSLIQKASASGINIVDELLNTRSYSREEVKPVLKYVNDLFGKKETPQQQAAQQPEAQPAQTAQQRNPSGIQVYTGSSSEGQPIEQTTPQEDDDFEADERGRPTRNWWQT